MRKRVGTEVSVNSGGAFAQLRMHELTAAANLSRLTIPMPELKHTLLATSPLAAEMPVRGPTQGRP